MFRKFSLLLLLVIGCSHAGWAQYEFNAWRFGTQLGLQFPASAAATPPIVAVTNPTFYALEASASVADSAGNLLCYTNGEKVWNRRNQLMPNGQLSGGCHSAAQGALLLPRPEHRGQYFLLTVDCRENQLAGGLRYSVVDMAQDAGDGAVLAPNSVPVPLPPGTLLLTEALTAVRHRNGTDYWVIVHGWRTNEYLSYPVLPTGLGTPVRSPVGSVHGAGLIARYSIDEAYGSLRASPDGHYLGATIPDQNAVEIFDFDNRNGQVSAARQVALAQPATTRPYGLEFSADNHFLYLTDASIAGAVANTGGLYQVDMRQPGLSATRVATGEFGTPLRGPDDRIYMPADGRFFSSNSLAVVELPNVAGAGCRFQPAGVTFTLGRVLLGLPNFPNRNRQQLRIASPLVVCAGEVAAFTATAVALDLPTGGGAGGFVWAFGDSATGAANQATGPSVQHRFQRAGTYGVVVTVATANGPLEQRLNIRVNNRPGLRLMPRDTLACDEPGVLLQASAQPAGTAFRWQDGSTGPTLRAQRPGRYTLEVRNAAGCMARDSVFISTRTCPVTIPTIITPNGDRQNQAFILKGLNAPDWSLRLYNRWGREVYAQDKYDNAWAAQGQPDGVYYYLLSNSTTGQRLKGWVEVLR